MPSFYHFILFVKSKSPWPESQSFEWNKWTKKKILAIPKSLGSQECETKTDENPEDIISTATADIQTFQGVEKTITHLLMYSA